MKLPFSMNLGLLVIRLMLAAVFIYHGQAKLLDGTEGFAGYLTKLEVPMPQLSAWLAALSEVIGGLLLIAGVGFRLALWPLVFTMMVAAFVAHAGKFNIQQGGMEYALTLGVVVAGLALTGPGEWSLKGMLSKER